MKKSFKVRTIEEMGSLIKASRKIAGLSQEHLALLLGISRTSIQLLEQGKKDINLGVFLKVMEILNITLKLDLSSPSLQLPPPEKVD